MKFNLSFDAEQMMIGRMAALRCEQREKVSEILELVAKMSKAEASEALKEEIRAARWMPEKVGELIALTQEIVTLRELFSKED